MKFREFYNLKKTRPAMVEVKRVIGQLKWTESNLNSPHIKQIIHYVSQETGTPETLIRANMENELSKYKAIHDTSPILYETMAANLAEAIAMDYIDKIGHRIPGRVKFDQRVFERLIRKIQIEHPKLFPLESPLQLNTIPANFAPVYVGRDQNDPKLQKYKSVSTAAVFKDGKFVFNKDYMQRLLDFAVLKNIQPADEKYKSVDGNPPQFPPAYAYLEFLILHEFYHWMHGDFNTMAMNHNYSHNVWNIATDLRSNYELLTRGYEQLPQLYFSKNINYEKQTSVLDMAKIVKQELDKLKQVDPNLAKMVQDFGHDEHTTGNEQAWQPKVGDLVRLPDGGKGVVVSTNGHRPEVKKLADKGDAA